jgi:ribosome-associated protein
VEKEHHIKETDFEISAIRSSGPGGQHANKVSTAVQLRFDIRASSLSDDLKLKLLEFKDKRISRDGIIIIKAKRYRSQYKNRADSIRRLIALINKVNSPRKKRKPTSPSKASVEDRLRGKAKRSKLKEQRKKVDPDY